MYCTFHLMLNSLVFLFLIILQDFRFEEYQKKDTFDLNLYNSLP